MYIYYRKKEKKMHKTGSTARYNFKVRESKKKGKKKEYYETIA